MTFTEYQHACARTQNTLLTPRDVLANYALGLAGEVGEVVDHIKKHLYHGHALDRAQVADELGDVLWYWAALATALDLDSDLVALINLAKLRARYPDGFDPVRSQQREEGRR